MRKQEKQYIAIGINGVNPALRGSGIEYVVEPSGGTVDSVSATGGIRGWVWKPDAPNDSIEAHIYIFDASGNKVLGKAVKASNFRQDLVNAGKGNGYHGYVYSVDWDSLPSGNLTVKVYAEVTPKPIISDDVEATITDKQEDNNTEEDIPTPTEDNGIVTDDLLMENPNPPIDIDGDVNGNGTGGTTTEDNGIVTDDLLMENPNPPTDIDDDVNENGTTVAPQTGDSANSVILMLSVLFSCLVIICSGKRCKQ